MVFSWGLPSCLAGGCILAVSSRGLSSCVHLPSVILKEGPMLMTLFNLHYLKRLSLHAVTLGVQASVYEFWGNTIQSLITPLRNLKRDPDEPFLGVCSLNGRSLPGPCPVAQMWGASFGFPLSTCCLVRRPSLPGHPCALGSTEEE